MSGILRGIKKVFTAVAKVAKVVLPIGLAVAAVVFTGGAALGLGGIFAGGFSGAVGGLVSSLGISGTLAGALTGSIVSAGFGAAGGLVMGGVKGAQKGAMFGALAGGALGALSPATFGVGTSAASTAATSTADGIFGNVAGSNGLLPTAAFAGPSSSVQPLPNLGGAPAAGSTVPGVPPGTPGTGTGNGLGSFFSNPTNTLVAGNLLTGLFTPSDSGEAARLREREGERLFSDIYSNPGDSGVAPNYGDARQAVRPVARYRFNPETLQVEEVTQGARPR